MIMHPVNSGVGIPGMGGTGGARGTTETDDAWLSDAPSVEDDCQFNDVRFCG